MQSTGSGSYVGTNTPTPCFSNSSTSTPIFIQEEGPRQRDRHFLAAIHTLQQLKTTFTPVQKLAVVGDMFKAITESREGVTWSMDTLLPVCMYVVVRARVLQLGAELAMLQELMEDFLFQVLSRVYQSKIVS